MRKFLVIFGLMFALSACASASFMSKDPLCVTDGPLTFSSKKDTKETIDGIKKHNSVWVCTCKNDCPKAVVPGVQLSFG